MPGRGKPSSSAQAVVAARGARVSAGAVDGVVEAAAPLVGDGDLVVAALALQACSRLLERQPASARAVTARVLPQALALAQSPLLQARSLAVATPAALQALKGLCQALGCMR